MRLYGSRVCVSRDDVAAFNSQWPCSGIPERPIWFEFDSNGLVDLGPGDTSEFDGPALLALSEDAQAYMENKRRKETNGNNILDIPSPVR